MAMDWTDFPVYFDREKFCNNILDVVTQYGNKFSLDDLLSYVEGAYVGFEYRSFKQDDTYYIIHLDSGTIVSWYKHLGRSACSNRDLTAYDLKTFIKGFIEDILY